MALSWSFPAGRSEHEVTLHSEHEVTLHVDVIRNDWSASQQIVVGRVVPVDGRLDIEWFEKGPWVPLVTDLVSQISESSNAAPKDQLGLMRDRINGSVVEASPPHVDEECPFIDRETAKMRSVAVDSF